MSLRPGSAFDVGQGRARKSNGDAYDAVSRPSHPSTNAEWARVAPFDWRGSDTITRSAFKESYSINPREAVERFALIGRMEDEAAAAGVIESGETMTDDDWYGGTTPSRTSSYSTSKKRTLADVLQAQSDAFEQAIRAPARKLPSTFATPTFSDARAKHTSAQQHDTLSSVLRAQSDALANATPPAGYAPIMTYPSSTPGGPPRVRVWQSKAIISRQRPSAGSNANDVARVPSQPYHAPPPPPPHEVIYISSPSTSLSNSSVGSADTEVLSHLPPLTGASPFSAQPSTLASSGNASFSNMSHTSLSSLSSHASASSRSSSGSLPPHYPASFNRVVD